MAKTTARRVNSRSDEYVTKLSFDGSAVRKTAVLPRRRYTAKETVVSEKTRRNRAHALSMSPVYVLFLAFISVMTVLMCVYYLQMKETVVSQTSQNAKLQSQLVSLQNENDALLENITNNIDWNHVRDVAINQMGMKYAAQDQVVWYNTEGNGYVRQYQEVPAADQG